MPGFRNLRRHYMTLLETLIAVTLLSMLLTFIFGFFRELSELSRLGEKGQKESFQMRYIESRLKYVFERIVNENETTKRTFFFYTQPANKESSTSTQLILTYNNGIRQEPSFSGDVLGKLYVDANHNLCLATWPLHVLEPHPYMHEEVLLSNVSQVRYHFYSPPEKIRQLNQIVTGKIIDPEKKTPEKDHWYEEEWLQTFEQMPVIIKMVLNTLDENKNSKELILFFVLPSSKNPVDYPHEE